MTLRELKQIVAEEYTAYKRVLREQGLPVPGELPGISVADTDIDATGGGGDAEGTLQKLFDILSDYFEGGADAGADADAGAGDDDELDVEDDEDKDDDKEEVSESKKKRTFKKNLQESKSIARFKKLANIKG